MNSLSFRFLFLFFVLILVHSQHFLFCKEIPYQTKPYKNPERPKLTPKKALSLLEDIEISCKNCLNNYLKKILSDDLKGVNKKIESDLKRILKITSQTRKKPFSQESDDQERMRIFYSESLNKIHQIASRQEKALSKEIKALEGNSFSKKSLEHLKGLRLIFAWIRISSGILFSYS